MLVYDNLRIQTLLYLGTVIPYDEKILNHLKIASKVELKQTKSAFLYVLVGFCFWVFYILLGVLYVLNVPFSSNKHVSIWWYLIPIFLAISMTLYILIFKMLMNRRIGKYSLSLLVASLVEIVISISNLNPSEEDLWDKARDNEVVMRQVIDISGINETGNDESKSGGYFIHVGHGFDDFIGAYNELRIKKRIVLEIEKSAKYIEYYIPRQLRNKDIIIDKWFHNSMRQVAAALREKKKWILTPKQDTYNNFIASMTSTLTCIVSDNWDALERKEPEKITRSASFQLILSYMLNVLKIFFIAVFPLVCLIVFQLTPYARLLTEAGRSIAFIFTFIWLGLTILINVDSKVSAKLSLMKEMKSLL